MISDYRNDVVTAATQFNILSSTHTYETLNEVIKHRKNAVEESEIFELYGWNLKYYKNRYGYFADIIKNTIEIIDEHKTLILALLFLFYIGINKGSNVKETRDMSEYLLDLVTFSFSDFKNSVESIASFASFFVAAIGLYKTISQIVNLKSHTSTSIVIGNDINSKTELIKAFIDQKNRIKYKTEQISENNSMSKRTKINYIYEIMYFCYFLEYIEENEDKNIFPNK